MSDLEKMMKEHIEQKAKKISNEGNRYYKDLIREILSTIQQEIVNKQKELDVLKVENKDNFAALSIMAEGGLLSLMELADNLNQWTLEKDQQILFDRTGFHTKNTK